MSEELLEGLRRHRIGLLASLLAILSGLVLGAVFGAWEAELLEGLRESGEVALAERYHDRSEELDAAVAEAWECYQRAHEHWAGIGAATLAVSLLLAGAMGSSVAARLASAALGIGAVVYPCFWLLVGRAAPRAGGMAPAADSLAWLATVSAGLLVLGAAGALVLISARLFGTGSA